MKILEASYAHPTQASRVRLDAYDAPEGGGFLVTESRVGTRTVVATLGVYELRQEAEEKVRSRGEELVRQGYRPLASAA